MLSLRTLAPVLIVRSSADAPGNTPATWIAEEAVLESYIDHERNSLSRAPSRHPVSREIKWIQLPSALTADKIIDRRPPSLITPASVMSLLYCLAPGGTYETTLECADTLNQTLSGQGAEAFDGQAFANYARVAKLNPITNHDSIQITNTLQRSTILRSIPLRELVPATSTALPAEHYQRTRPVLHIPNRLEEQLAALTFGFAPAQAPPGEIAILRDAMVVGYGQVVVGQTVVEESFVHNFHLSTRGQFHPIGHGDYICVAELADIPEDRVVSDLCVVLKQNWDTNYGHWLIDTFGRLCMMADYCDLRSLRFLVNSPTTGKMKQIFLESLGLLGIPEQSVLFSSTHTWLLRKAIYPTPVTRAPLVKHPAVIRFLRSLVPLAVAAGGRNHSPTGRIYLSRARYGKRAATNEDDFVGEFIRSGYAVLHPEELSLVDQIVTFGNAERIAGIMGAAFSSLAFCKPGVKVLSIGTESMQHDYFYDIVCLLSGLYVGVQGKAVDPGSGIASDFTIDRTELLGAAYDNGFLDHYGD